MDKPSKKGSDYTEQKRQEKEKKEIQFEQMLGSIADLASNFNIDTINFGDTKVELVEKEKKVFSQTKEEEELTNLLNNGKPLYVLSVDNAFTFYKGKENTDIRKHDLSEVLDIELIHVLAPSCKIYGCKNKKPWQKALNISSFALYVTENDELEKLWKNIRKWMRFDWHDKVANVSCKAEEVFTIHLYSHIAPDIGWRLAKSQSADKKESALHKSNGVDSLAEKELKKVLSSLVQIEDHPLFSAQIQELITKTETLLEKSMESKSNIESAKKERVKAQKNLDKAYSYTSIPWKKYKVRLPIEIIPDITTLDNKRKNKI